MTATLPSQQTARTGSTRWTWQIPRVCALNWHLSSTPDERNWQPKFPGCGDSDVDTVVYEMKLPDKKHDKIRVEFVESGEDKPFAVSIVPAGQLPDTFEVATTLDLSGKKWSVVDADPKQKSDFEKSGQLKVVLSQLPMADSKDMLYSLPTLNDRMCALQETESLDGMLVIHEDDWRQVEFVSDKLQGDVETELASIKTIYETKRKGVGFTGLHIRKLIETPIEDGVVPYTALKNLVTISKEFSGFGISSYMAAAERGFAFETKDGLRFYGVLSPTGNVVFLCLANTDGFAGRCGDIMKTFHLVGVDWCKCQTVRK